MLGKYCITLRPEQESIALLVARIMALCHDLVTVIIASHFVYDYSLYCITMAV